MTISKTVLLFTYSTSLSWKAVDTTHLKVDVSIKQNHWLRIPHHSMIPVDTELLQKTRDIMNKIEKDSDISLSDKLETFTKVNP